MEVVVKLVSKRDAGVGIVKQARPTWLALHGCLRCLATHCWPLVPAACRQTCAGCRVHTAAGLKTLQICEATSSWETLCGCRAGSAAAMRCRQPPFQWWRRGETATLAKPSGRGPLRCTAAVHSRGRSSSSSQASKGSRNGSSSRTACSLQLPAGLGSTPRLRQTLPLQRHWRQWGEQAQIQAQWQLQPQQQVREQQRRQLPCARLSLTPALAQKAMPAGLRMCTRERCGSNG